MANRTKVRWRPSEVHTKLQAVLNSLHKSRRWLAARSGIPYRTVVEYCTGTIRVPADRLELMQKAIYKEVYQMFNIEEV